MHSDDGMSANMSWGVGTRLSEGPPAFDAPSVGAPQVTLGPRGDAILAGFANAKDLQMQIEMEWTTGLEGLARPSIPDKGSIKAIGTKLVSGSQFESIEVATFDFDRPAPYHTAAGRETRRRNPGTLPEPRSSATGPAAPVR
jgi:hypothetical protein